MKISQKAIDELIKASEGYHDKQSDGSCKSYKCPAGVWTIGHGVTSGIGPNMHWTAAEAEAALRRELAQHEIAVEKMVKVPLNQGQFDSLVSLSYNIGAAAVAKSTLIQHLNRGDYARAASHFADFKYSRVTGSTAIRMKVKDGTKVVLPGLVTRRALEMQFFLEADPVGEVMSQKVEKPRFKLDIWGQIKAAFAAISTLGVVGVSGTLDQPFIPPPPVGLKQSFAHLGQWSDAVPYHQWQTLGVGAAVCALAAIGSYLLSRAK